MKASTGTGLGYFAIAALVVGAVTFAATPAAAGNAYGKGGNPGKGNGQAQSAANSNGNSNLASAMGSLNAAHASGQGLAHANRSHSRVGMLASYMDAMAVYEDFIGQVTEMIDGGAAVDDPEVVEKQGFADAALLEAAGHLEGVANKEINGDVVDAVDGLLDGK